MSVHPTTSGLDDPYLPIAAPPPTPSESGASQLLRAVQTGNLATAQLALDDGTDPNLPDKSGEPGLPLRLAAFHGHGSLVQELVKRGAQVNPPVRRLSSYPIASAAYSGQGEMVRLLLELGSEIPRGLDTGLSLREILAAQGIAHRSARIAANLGTRNHPLSPDAHIEEIDLQGCFGVDTATLDADLIRLAMSGGDSPSPDESADRDETAANAGLFKFWKR